MTTGKNKMSEVTVKPTITPEQAKECQKWAGMDGAVAWRLIGRHAENWADIGLMMDAWLEANTPPRELLESLQRLMANNCPYTGTPTHAQLVAFWQSEKEQGCGDAEDMLFALAAISKATGTA
jgi:hypothetical protein